MRSVILLLTLLFSLFSLAIEPQVDLIARSKVDHKSSDELLKKIETFMRNNQLGNISSSKIEKPLIVEETILADHFDAKSRELVQKISGFLPFDIGNTKLEIALRGVYYKIKNLSVELTPNGENFIAEFKASGVCMKLDELNLTIKVPMMQGEHLPTYAPRLVDSTLLLGNINEAECNSSEIINSIDNNKPLSFTLELSTKINEEDLAINIVKANFDKVADFVKNKRDQIKLLGLNKQNLHVDDVVLEYGPKEIIFYGSKIVDLLLEKKASYLNLLMDQLYKITKNGELAVIVEDLKGVTIDKGYWIDSTDYKTYISIDRIQKSNVSSFLDKIFSTGFCTQKDFEKYDVDCLKEDKLYYEMDPSYNFEQSIKYLDQLTVQHKDATLIASASENFLNKIIDLTFKAGYWASEFDTSEIEIGPDGGFVKLNRKGNKAKFYMQIKYNAKKIHQHLIGARKFDLLIPIVCEVSLKIVLKNNIPVIKFVVDSIDTSEQTLMYGDKYVSSTLHKVKRFKKMIMNKYIIPEAKNYIGKSAVDVEFPEIRDLDIQNLDLDIDGNGRVNVIFK